MVGGSQVGMGTRSTREEHDQVLVRKKKKAFLFHESHSSILKKLFNYLIAGKIYWQFA